MTAELRYAVLLAEGRRMYCCLQACWLAELQVPDTNLHILRSLEDQMRLLENAFRARGFQL